MSGLSTLQRDVAAVEQALSTEIHRRSDLEERLSAQVSSEVRAAIRKAAGAIEEQLSFGYRRHVDDVSTRLLALERSLGVLRQCQETEAAKPDLLAMGVSSSSGCDRQIAGLETRVATLEQTKSYDVLPLEVARQLQVMRGQLLDEAASRWADVAQPLQAETVGNRQRVDALEQWLREALAPELVRLQLDLASERRCRERLETAVNKHVALSKTLERASITPRRHTQTLQGSQATLTSLQHAPPFAPSDNLDKCAFSASSEALRTGVELASSQSRQSRSVPLVPDAAPRESALHGHVEASLTTEKADRVESLALEVPPANVDLALQDETAQITPEVAQSDWSEDPAPQRQQRALLGRMRRSLKR